MTCDKTPQCPSPCGDCPPERWPIPAGNEYGERAKFEAWAKKRAHPFHDREPLLNHGAIDRYSDIAWQAWQARAALASSVQAQAGGVAVPEGYKLLEDGKTTIPNDWTWCRIEHEPGYPEDVAFGPRRMMDRLKKWLDAHFAQRVAGRNLRDELGYEVRNVNGVWLLIDDCDNEREATLVERVLWDALIAATPTAGAGMVLAEREALRAGQSAAVMPLIGPLLDAWDGMSNDARAEVLDEAPDLAKYLSRIGHAMEAAPSPTPAPAATTQPDHEATLTIHAPNGDKIVCHGSKLDMMTLDRVVKSATTQEQAEPQAAAERAAFFPPVRTPAYELHLAAGKRELRPDEPVPPEGPQVAWCEHCGGCYDWGGNGLWHHAGCRVIPEGHETAWLQPAPAPAQPQLSEAEAKTIARCLDGGIAMGWISEEEAATVRAAMQQKGGAV